MTIVDVALIVCQIAIIVCLLACIIIVIKYDLPFGKFANYNVKLSKEQKEARQTMGWFIAIAFIFTIMLINFS